MSHTKCWSYRTWTGWNIWQYYPSLDQIQSDHHKCKIKARYCSIITLLLDKLLGAENPTGEIVYICFLLLKVQTFLSISLFSFFGKNHNALLFFFMEDCIHCIRWRKKNFFVCFWLFQCLLPLKHDKNRQFAKFWIWGLWHY